MPYCPACGGEVVDEAAYVCYRCGSRLRDVPSGDEVTGETFLTLITLMLDREIASATTNAREPVPEDTQLPEQLDSVIDRISHHAIGYGKGFTEAMLIEGEAARDDVEYDTELYQSFFDYVGDTVEQRKPYIEAAIRDGPGGE